MARQGRFALSFTLHKGIRILSLPPLSYQKSLLAWCFAVKICWRQYPTKALQHSVDQPLPGNASYLASTPSCPLLVHGLLHDATLTILLLPQLLLQLLVCFLCLFIPLLLQPLMVWTGFLCFLDLIDLLVRGIYTINLMEMLLTV